MLLTISVYALFACLLPVMAMFTLMIFAPDKAEILLVPLLLSSAALLGTGVTLGFAYFLFIH